MAIRMPHRFIRAAYMAIQKALAPTKQRPDPLSFFVRGRALVPCDLSVSANSLEVEDLAQDNFENRRRVIDEAAIAIAVIEAVFITAPTIFTKVVVVVVPG